MFRCLVTWLLLLGAWTLQAQMPDLKEGEVVYEKSFGDRSIRLWQIPGTAREHIPIRFLFEEVTATSKVMPKTNAEHSSDPDTCVLCAQGGAPLPEELTQALTAYDTSRIAPEPGSEAAYTFRPATHELHFWSTNLLEIRETFRTAGNYELSLSSEEFPMLDLRIPVKVEPALYIQFGPEFGAFVIGCGIIGMGLFLTVKYLHQRSRQQHQMAPTLS